MGKCYSSECSCSWSEDALIKGTAETYCAFTRTWWRRIDIRDINKLEPHAGRKTTIARHCTYEEALSICQHYNSTHKPGRLSRKAEFTRED